ncbi:MAG: transglutaminase domain-containing protein [archaeon]
MDIDQLIEDPSFFTKSGHFTEKDQRIKNLVDRNFKGIEDDRAKLSAISEYVASIKYQDNPKKFRKLNASDIKKHVTGNADRAILFCTLAREAGIAARYVETVETAQETEYASTPKVIEDFRESSSYARSLGERLENATIDVEYATQEIWGVWKLYIEKKDDATVSKDFCPEKLMRILFPDAINCHAFVDVFIDGKWQTYDPITGFTQGQYETGGLSFEVIGKGLDFGAVHIIKRGRYSEEPTDLSDPKKGIEIYRKHKD